ncbi:hypothetical protein IQ07DRAFT_525601 [Pyrenochaeta sp. DS3sAY3a]|nr:hypothetical protein IQ07DRAFT_525601 [Pyrenochaeta sp. DS3sAY3a]
MLFLAVEWDKLKNLVLACNPAIKELIINKQRIVVQYIASNYRLYYKQLRALSLLH